MAKIPPGVGPRFPQVVVLFGATGDLARRKLLPGLFHLSSAGFIPGCRIIGVSLDDLDADAFRASSRAARSTSSSSRKVTDADWGAFAANLDYVPLAAGAGGAARPPSTQAEASIGGESRRLHYLSVPPSAALSAVRLLGEAGLVERSRIVMEKPFGTDLASARVAEREAARGVRRGADLSHRSLPRQGAGAEHPRVPFRERPVRADLEPQLHRPRADRRARDARPRQARGLLRADRRVTATWWSRTCSRSSRSWRWSRRHRSRPRRSAKRRTRCSAACCRSSRRDVVRGQYTGYRSEEGVEPESRNRDVHRAQVLRSTTGAGPACRSTCAPARAWPRASASSRSRSASRRRACSRADSGVGAQGPDHLTFDLADASKMSLSFYGKRPGPGMRLDKLSLQFAMNDTGADRRRARGLRAADPRCDARRSHAVHDGRRHRAALGSVDAAARSAAAGALVRAGLVGTERDPPADRAARLAPAVRARVARSESSRRVTKHPAEAPPRCKSRSIRLPGGHFKACAPP